MRHDFHERPAQAGAIEASRPIQFRPVILRPEKDFRFCAAREDVDMGRPMIVDEDDEAQVSGTMDGRHEQNIPSDGLFKNPSDGIIDCCHNM